LAAVGISCTITRAYIYVGHADCQSLPDLVIADGKNIQFANRIYQDLPRW